MQMLMVRGMIALLCIGVAGPTWALKTLDITKWEGNDASSAWPTDSTFGRTRPPSKKKVIYVGWSTQRNEYIRKYWQSMEQLPFNGVAIMAYPDGKDFGGLILSTETFSDAGVQKVIDDLQSAHWTRFTDNFLLVPMTGMGARTNGDKWFDWFDEDRWTAIRKHFRQLAIMAKESQCKGFMMDPEQYWSNLWQYEGLQKHIDKPLKDYQTMVRQRGREVMTELKAIYPDITIFTFWCYMDWARWGSSLETSTYGLYSNFLDGMLEVLYRDH
jgi:hypothetical protein